MYGDGSVTGKISIALSKVTGVIELHVAGFSDLDTVTLYAILQLRSDVFVVEQDCAYSDVDGRDAEPGTRHLWLATDVVPEPARPETTVAATATERAAHPGVPANLG